jgi:ring-1,2-phenylacetyl-CoA epoxidase subunit PaaE
MSLIKTTLKREPRSCFTLLYGNRRLATTMFQEELEDLKDCHLRRFTLHNLFTREHQDVELLNGRLDAAKINAFAERLLLVDTIDEAFVCGPHSMLDEIERALRERGLAADHIHLERWCAGWCRAPRRAATHPSTRHGRGRRAKVEFREGDPAAGRALRAGLTCLTPARRHVLHLPH